MKNNTIKKIVLAYSGGLDTSIIIPWLKENYNNPEIIAVSANVGQADELDGLEEKALKTGASKIYIEDITEDFLTNYVFPCVQAGALYENYMLGTAFARPPIAKRIVEIALAEEADKLVDEDAVKAEALYRAENDGIVFIDEIDKIAGKGERGADVSREGVQRDILPIVEGSTVVTKYGPVKTDFVLFIAAGAFHVSSIEDLIPELQGRFPVSVELQSLTKEDFIRILTETQNSLTFQYAELLSVDNIELKFEPDAIERIAEISVDLNATSEDIGARRLHTVMEYLLEDVSFNAGGMDVPAPIPVAITGAYVDEHLSKLTGNRDLKKYVL